MTLAQKAFEIYRNHGYGGQSWMSDRGYIVECRCGETFPIGHTPNFEELARSTRHQELWDKQDLTSADDAELARLNKAWGVERKAKIDARTKLTNKLLRAPIEAHILGLFEALLDRQQPQETRQP